MLLTRRGVANWTEPEVGYSGDLLSGMSSVLLNQILHFPL